MFWSWGGGGGPLEEATGSLQVPTLGACKKALDNNRPPHGRRQLYENHRRSHEWGLGGAHHCHIQEPRQGLHFLIDAP